MQLGLFLKVVFHYLLGYAFYCLLLVVTHFVLTFQLGDTNRF